MNARTDLPALAAIRAIEDEMLATRHQIHANPELGFEELATSDLVAERLQRWGYAVHRGLGKTGVVGTLVCGDGQKRLGIRADMDALPIVETSGRPWASRAPRDCRRPGRSLASGSGAVAPPRCPAPWAAGASRPLPGARHEGGPGRQSSAASAIRSDSRNVWPQA